VRGHGGWRDPRQTS